MATELCKKVYAITRQGDFQYDTRFVQQIRAASGSVMDNIAEGFERDGKKEFINFLYIAKGSCGEVRSQLIRAHEVDFIDNIQFAELQTASLQLSKSIASFINSLRYSDVEGLKYKKHQKPET